VGYGPKQTQARLYRGQIPSPGRPTGAWREDRVRFWAAIAGGARTEDACVEARVSGPVGFRWFHHASGVNPWSAVDLVGPVLVLRRARGDRAAAGSGSWCA
jgi:hypothetical protein